jgi:uncharacterized repeat protein (TIGR01451 family)
MATPERRTVAVCLCLAAALRAQSAVPWSSYAHDPQHTGLSTIGAQRLEQIRWSIPIDLVLQNSSGPLYIHYGTPLVTAANTVLVPVRTSASNTYRVEAHSGANGNLIYSLPTDYTPPPYEWIPSYSPSLSQGTRLYYAGAGGTVYYRDQPDSATGPSGQIAFYGNALYTANQAAFAGTVMISTPITADADGNIYFGFDVTGANPANLTSGVARISADGTGLWISASAAAQGDTTIVEVAMNCAPAVSNDGSTLYFGVSEGPIGNGYSPGYLVAVNSTTLAPVARVRLTDPATGSNALVLDASSASPTVGPDGDVYYGAFESSCCTNDDRGWLLHFDSTLTHAKTPGLFGWDTTPSVVPASLVASYTGLSSYLLFTKYNNYNGIGPGGNGHNKVAVLDPNNTETDAVTGASVMQEVIAILGPTLSPPGNSNGSVREWCINSGAIDPFSGSAMANSEDGTIYRWSFATNSPVQQVTLTAGVGEAYTPTAIGADGTAYAINDGNLFAIGQASSPAILSSHIGAFVQGQSSATYTLTVTNSGSAETNGIVTVTDTLPASLTATAIGGSGWACTQPSGPCSRSDMLTASGSFPALTLTVNVAGTAPASVTNSAAVSSDGAINTVNSRAYDVTGIDSLPSLSIAVTNGASFTEGQVDAAYTVTVSNASGAGTTSGAVTVVETVPTGLTLVSMAGAGWTCPSNGNICTRSDPLAAGTPYPAITVLVDVAANAASPLANAVAVSGGGSASANATDNTTVIAVPALSLTKTADALNVLAGSSIGYTVTVTNSGGAAATAAMLNDPLPAGTGISWSISPSYGGSGTCAVTGSVGSQTLSCSYGSLAAAASATVHVTSGTGISSCASYPNTATVTAGNSNSLQSSATTTVQCPGPLSIVTSSVPWVTQYLSYSTTLQASGGTPPYTWSVVSSTGVSLPEGMSLDPASGIVSATQVNGQGGYLVTVQVTDSATPSPAVVTQQIPFGVYSDTSFAGCPMFPPDNIYNQPVSQLPVDTNPQHQIPSGYLNAKLHPDFGQGFYPGPGGIPWMRVAANQPLSNVNLENGGQIDQAGLYSWPIPPWPGAAVEGTSDGLYGEDHHILVLESSVNNISGPQTGPCTLYETYQGIAVPNMFDAASNTWTLTAAAHYVLNSDEIAASNSTLDNGAQDSPGIPLVPLLLRYSEVPLGAQHPLRITFPSPTNWYAWPATGCCSGSGPPQGLLYRLKASVNWQATCPVSSNPQAATFLQALQQYGAYMSDHGSSGYVQGVPDVRWNDNDLACIKNFTVSDLEVVDNSALQVSATSGQTKPYVVPATLPVFAVGTAYNAAISVVGGNPATVQLAISSGAMPPGLSLNPAAGTISGTPTSSAGSPYNVGITATDTASGLSSMERQFVIQATVLPVPDLTVALSHSGNFTLDQTGAMYSITVSNSGTASTSGTVTVVDTLPAGFTATAMSGAGWNCTVATVTCTRSDVLPAGGAYPLSLTVNVGSTPPSQVTNIATVSGGGEVNTANDQASDPTTVSQVQSPQSITFPPISNQVLGASPFPIGATASSGLPVSFNSQTTAVCTVSGTTVTLLSAGTCTIQATQTGDAGYSAAPLVSQSFQVLTAQTITFGGLANQTFGAAPFTVSASSTSGLTVSFNSQTTPVCTVSGSLVTLVAGGACTIQATQAGNTTYAAAAAVNQSFTVLMPQTITFAGLANQTFGAAPFTVSASSSAGLTVSFNSQTTSVCTVSGSLVTLVAGGTCKVQATQAGNTTYAAAPNVSQSFMVNPEGQTITFGGLSIQTFGAAPFTVNATATSNLPVSFNSQTPSICTVSSATVTLLSGGTCTIQATQAGNASYNAAPNVSQNFLVNPASQTIVFGTLSAQTFGAAAFTVSASATSNLPVSFNSQTTSICTVLSATVTLLSGGTCTIQATQAGNTSYSAAPNVNQSFTVNPESQTITFATLPSQAFGASPFTVSASATSNLPVSFASQTTSICTVLNATVTLLSGGTCTIQANQAGNASYSAAPPVNQSFLVTSSSQTITFGTLPNEALGAAPFTVSASATSTLPVSFNSQTTSICTVSTATVTLLAIGTCTIQATQAGNATYAAAPNVNRSFLVTGGLAVPGGSVGFANTIVGKPSATLTTTLQNSGNAALIITSIAPTGADAANYQYTVDAAHPCPISPATLAAGAACTLDVTFVPLSQGAHNNAQLAVVDNSGNAPGSTQTIGLTGMGIVLSSLAINAVNASVASNSTEQFTATGTYSDSSTANLTSQATWNSSAPGVATIAAGGVATAVSPGQTNITVTQGSVTSNSFQLTVLPGTASGISVYSGSPQSTTVGTAFGSLLQALVKDSAGNAVPNAQVTFTAPSTGAGATFANGQATYTATTNSSGIATSLSLTANATAGSYSVTASATGMSTTASFSLTNLKAPILTILEAPANTFVQGQTAVFTITVGNAAGAGPTSGPVTVTETVPNGLTLLSMSGGPAWNCTVPASCTANAVLNGGSTFPAITVTLSLPSNAPALLTNQVSASGGGSAPAAALDPTPVFSACTVTQSSSPSVTDVQQLINEALGIAPPANDMNGDTMVNVLDVQIVLNAAMGLGCTAS